MTMPGSYLLHLDPTQLLANFVSRESRHGNSVNSQHKIIVYRYSFTRGGQRIPYPGVDFARSRARTNWRISERLPNT